MGAMGVLTVLTCAICAVRAITGLRRATFNPLVSFAWRHCLRVIFGENILTSSRARGARAGYRTCKAPRDETTAPNAAH